MTTEDIQRVLGRLETGIDNLAARQAEYCREHNDKIELIFEKLEAIASNGCATGKRNAEAIKELRDRPGNLIGLGAAIASILAFIGTALNIWRNQ